MPNQICRYIYFKKLYKHHLRAMLEQRSTLYLSFIHAPMYILHIFVICAIKVYIIDQSKWKQWL